MLKGVLVRLRALLRKNQMERELEEEMRFHLERAVEQNIAQGMDHKEARLAALREFGGLEQAKEKCRDVRGVRLLEEMWRDLHYGARMLRKQPSFTFFAVLTIALGIGANTAIFSVADKLLLRSLPVNDPSELTLVSGETVNPKFQNDLYSHPDYLDYRAQNEVFSGLLAFAQVFVRLGEGEQSDKLSIELVSGNYFDVLGLTAAQGRAIQEEDNRHEDAHPVAIISHNCWQRRFGGRRDVLGQTLRLNGLNYSIIGIAPAGFTGMRLEAPAEAWTPLMMRRQLLGGTTSNFERRGGWLRLMGRLKPGLTMAEAQASFGLMARRIWEANTPIGDRNRPFSEKRILLEPGGQGLSFLRRTLGETVRLLLAVVWLLLALACANVANLLLARAAWRRKEIAVRLALGATRWQIIRQLLTESLLLAGLGAGASLLFAPWLYELLLAFQPGFIIERSTLQDSLDGRVLAFTALTAVVSGVLFGLVPAWQSAQAEVISALKNTSADQRARLWNVRGALVVAQVALALVMLVGAGLLVGSLQRMFAIDPGFRAENLLIVALELPRVANAAANDEAGRQTAGERNNQYFFQLAERVKALPGVESASTASITPFSGNIGQSSARYGSKVRIAPPRASSPLCYLALCQA